MSLRRYQQAALDALRAALARSAVAGPAAAFAEATGRAYRPLEGVPDAPCFCLRLPTGAGKTLLAAHAVRVAGETVLGQDFPLVLWLVSSTAIAQQTVEALRDRRFLPRQALEAAYGPNALRVLELDRFTELRPQDLGRHCVVVVGTMQAFRVEDEAQRAVYQPQEDWDAHFAALPRGVPLAGMRLGADGRPVQSFANLLHALRPLVVVDEAHNAMTALSREVQRRLNPAAVLEWTATPRPGANLLHRTDAAALKAEDMVKLPIRLTEHGDWRQAVAGAVAERRALATAAAREGAGVRPIILYQAEGRNGTVTVEALKAHLMDAEQVPEAAIAVHTGSERGLDSQDLLAPGNPIEHVITVQALKEGWDCPFAYVLCSVARSRSAVAAEQLLGRVMRMPFARRQREAALNCAYAHMPAGFQTEALQALRRTLVEQMGFEAGEAEAAVQPAQAPLFDGLAEAQEPFTLEVEAAPGLAERLRRPGIAVEETPEGRLRLTLRVVDAAAEATLREALPEAARPALAAALHRHRGARAAPATPAARGEALLLPGLAWPVGDGWAPLDPETLMDDAEWSLSDHPARLDARLEEAEGAARFVLDVAGGQVVQHQEGRQAALDLGEPEAWSQARLDAWLGRELFGRDPALQEHTESALADWAARGLHGLRLAGTAPAALARFKYVILAQLRGQLAAARRAARLATYQRGLGLARADAAAAPFTFREGIFADTRPYRGPFRPQRHFLAPMPDFDGAEAGEEVACAMALDALPGLDTWLRNVARHRHAFRLPLAEGWFYPDFVARLADGRWLVVEYKGAHLAATPDTAAKAAVGAVWAARAGGVFALVRGDGGDAAAQLRRALSG